MLILLRFVILLLVLVSFAHSNDYFQDPDEDIYLPSSDGGTVKCVNKLKQPAFVDNDLLKDHKLQESPSEIPRTTKRSKKSKWRTTEARVTTAKCPQGTIPVRVDDVTPSNKNASVHEYAEGFTNGKEKLYGTRATLNVWKPKVEDRDIELSIAQLWITSGSYETNDLNTIEVGWQVYPQLYKDDMPRLFTYWTSNTYNDSGCYNLRCAGFVQISNTIVLGGAITPISVCGGRQYEITLLVWKDKKYGNWWLSLGPDNELIGYWPSQLFSGLDHASHVEWGGEIVDSHTRDRHTTTQMGSGHFPDEGFGKASYVRNIEVLDSANRFQSIQKLETYEDADGKYYNVQNLDRDEWGTHFFYGGPGYSHLRSGVVSLKLTPLFIYLWFSFFIIL